MCSTSASHGQALTVSEPEDLLTYPQRSEQDPPTAASHKNGVPEIFPKGDFAQFCPDVFMVIDARFRPKTDRTTRNVRWQAQDEAAVSHWK